MIRSRNANLIVIGAISCMLTILGILMYAHSNNAIAKDANDGYIESLFSTDKVHSIDIVVNEDDWRAMLDNAQSEEYILVDVVIDGTAVSGVGIRPKGNSSLSTIAQSSSDRYSFKIEFDHYINGKTYQGLDKVALNNIAQDNTYMKDYISYQMMNAMDAYAPLSSFIWVTVNGEDWGLYLAVEAVEESFVERVIGSTTGNLYKPDTMDMNGGEGAGGFGGGPGGDFDGGFPAGGQMPEGIPNFSEGQMPEGMEGFSLGQAPEGGQLPEGMPQMGGRGNGGNGAGGGMGDFAAAGDAEGFGGPGGPGGMGGMGNNSAVALVYTDDDPNSYSAIFDNAKLKTTSTDKQRLISALKQLNEGSNIEEVVNTNEVIRYFVVHNFVLNSDSYTGSMTHNYYLYEQDGQLAMIAWDYNLAFGGMGMGMGMGMGAVGMGGDTGMEDADGTPSTTSATLDTATQLVNYPIDSPMLSGTTGDRPMIAWIFEDEEYLAQYHEVFGEFVEYFESGKFAAMYDNAIALITPYVEKDPTSFVTYSEFLSGSAALRTFCLLRAESVKGQLTGTIAATSEGQAATSYANLIDASSVDIESMGSNAMGFSRARTLGQNPEGALSQNIEQQRE